MIADSDFNIVGSHFTLEALLQGQDGSVDSVLQLQFFAIAARQKES